MAKVSKRKLPSGLIRWQASYVDGAGQRRAKLFSRKSDGEAWLVKVSHDLSQGLHTPAATSPTVAQAGQLWLKRGRDKNLEEMTLKYYEARSPAHQPVHRRQEAFRVDRARGVGLRRSPEGGRPFGRNDPPSRSLAWFDLPRSAAARAIVGRSDCRSGS